MRVLSGVFGLGKAAGPFGQILRSERLALRPLVAGDRHAVAEYLSELDVARWLVRVPCPYRLADADAFIEQSILASRLNSAITLGLCPGGDERAPIIGVVALHSLDREPEFGYWIGRPFWGLGLMGEAAEALLTHAYHELDLDEIASGAFAGNAASLAIQARQGFSVVGASRKMSLADGLMRDHVDTRLTRAAHALRPRRPR